jgi:hypothetical protein
MAAGETHREKGAVMKTTTSPRLPRQEANGLSKEELILAYSAIGVTITAIAFFIGAIFVG